MIYIGLFFLSLLLTYLIRKYTLNNSILDIPNERSSHSTAIPRGGGLAIIIVFYLGIFYFQKELDTSLFLAFFTALPIIIVSLIDDIKPLSSRRRLLVQAFSAILALYILGGIEEIDFILFSLSGFCLNVLEFFLILWLTNLYNFLDGIDGYAATQTTTIGIGITVILLNPLGLVLTAGSLGFLVFNWDKATIFMGDVGSATLGFILAIFIVSDTSNGIIYFWLISLSLFWFDATVTLFRRYKNNEKIMEAHKKHAYQRLVQSSWHHSSVSLGLLVFNMIFLFLLYVNTSWSLIFVVNLLTLYIVLK